jgi:hypothetical protein
MAVAQLFDFGEDIVLAVSKSTTASLIMCNILHIRFLEASRGDSRRS